MVISQKLFALSKPFRRRFFFTLGISLERVPLRHYAALLIRYLRPHWKRVVLLGVFMFTGIGLNLINPKLSDILSTRRRQVDPVQNLVWAGVAFLAIGIVRQGVQIVSSYLGQDVGWRATNQMRNNLAHHCLNLDMGFHTATHAGRDDRAR